MFFGSCIKNSEEQFTRRHALKAIAFSALPLSAHPATQVNRSLHLYRPSTGEVANEQYWHNGEMNVRSYVAICSLLRDVKSNSVVQMAIPLLDVLSWMQAYFSIYGWSEPFIVHSGYRTEKTNRNTEGAAKNSLHQLGMAVDISINGVPASYLGDFLKRLGRGGVGVYQSGKSGSGFVHLDVGRVRSWRS